MLKRNGRKITNTSPVADEFKSFLPMWDKSLQKRHWKLWNITQIIFLMLINMTLLKNSKALIQRRYKVSFLNRN